MVVEGLYRYQYLPAAGAERLRLLRGGKVSPDLEMLLRAWTLPAQLLLAPGAAAGLAVAIGEGAPIAPEAVNPAPPTPLPCRARRPRRRARR